MTDVARGRPAFAERNVPVALATDENYLPYAKVVINSAIANSADSNLDFLILHSGIGDGAIQDFTARYAGLENVSVRFVDVSGSLGETKLADFKQVDRLPVSAFYRLLIPDILTAYDKVVYLDADVAVCRDLGELYATDPGDCYLAAAKDIIHSTKPEYLAWAAGCGFTEWDGYVNAGVLVMNLKKFRSEPVRDRLFAVAADAVKWFCAQDALNFVCKGRIAPLDPRWNVQLGDYCIKEQIALTGDEMWIAHFTNPQKPWKFPVRRYSHHWWLHVDEADLPSLWAKAWGSAHVTPSAGATKVSVVIPVCNAARYLPEALASVLAQQEMPEVEVICVDDGSTDDSAAILKFWEGRDCRLKVVRQQNLGPGVARNVGINAAKGEFIFFLDADDRLSSGAALREAYEQAAGDGLDILLADASNMAETGEAMRKGEYLLRELLPEARVFPPEALGVNLYVAATMSPWAKLFRRGFIEENNLRFPALRRSEDFPFVQLAMSLARRIGAIPRQAVCHRIDVTTSLEATKDETPLAFAEAERIFRDSLARHGLSGKFTMAANVAHIIYIAYNLRRVRRFSSFRAVAQYCAAEFPKLKLKGDEVGITAFAGSFKRISCVAAAANDTDRLAEIFAELQVSARLRISRTSTSTAILAKDAALEQLRGSTAQLRGNIEKQREAIAAKDASLVQLRGATAQLRGNVEKQREAIAARDAALAQLRGNIEKLREAIAAKDAALAQLRGTIEKQREAIAAKDAALAQLRGATAQLREVVELQRKSMSDKDKAVTDRDVAIERLRRDVVERRHTVDSYAQTIRKLKEIVDI